MDKPLVEWDWKTLAAIIDTEGSIMIFAIQRYRRAEKLVNRSPEHRPVIKVSMTDKEFVENLVANFGGYFCFNGNTGKNRPQWVWEIHNRSELKLILKSVLPFLIIKQRQAQLVLDFISIGCQVKNNQLRAEYRKQMRELNTHKHRMVEN